MYKPRDCEIIDNNVSVCRYRIYYNLLLVAIIKCVNQIQILICFCFVKQFKA